MSWNYRVVKVRNPRGDFLEIREVHYDAAGKITGWTGDASAPLADDQEGLVWVLWHMMAATAKPMLEEIDGKLIEVIVSQEPH